MNDPHARAILNSAALHLGSNKPAGALLSEPDIARLTAENEAMRALLVRASEVLGPFAGVPEHGKHGGPMVIASACYEDMGKRDTAPRAAFMHPSDFRAARDLKAEIEEMVR